MENTEKDFSDGFVKDLADLLEFCMKNKTDSTELTFDYGGNRLKVDITFSIE
jgi:hypothetical protein